MTIQSMPNEQGCQKIGSLLQEQRGYFAAGATRDWAARREALGRLESALVSHRDEIIEALSEDLAKPDVEAYLAEYYFLLQELRLIRKRLKKWLKTRSVGVPPYFQPCRAEVRREPFGTVLILAPWNYPIQLSLSPLMAAIAAGNTVVLKPSELAPASEKLLVKLIGEAFDPRHVAVVCGDASVAEDLLERKFDFIFFTGSTHVGRIVAEQAAKHLTPNILELGGKCPCVVDETANLKVAARRILTGKFFNGGQTCFAPDFVVCPADVREVLVKEMVELLGETPWRDEMARVINGRNYRRLQAMIPESALQFGDDEEGELRLAPRLVADAEWTDAVMEEEIFGPILPLVTYSGYDDLIARLMAYGKPLALYVFSEDQSLQNRLLHDVPSGGVCINDTMKQGSNINLPFGGVGDSGYGRYRGKAGVQAFSYERAVVKRPSWAPEFFELMPPYAETIKWLKRFLR